MLSRQRTIAVTCSTSRRLILVGSRVAAAVTLATSGTTGGCSATRPSASSMTSAAGAISGNGTAH